MLEHWQHGHLYAITPTADPLSEAPEPYLACETPDGWRFLHAPHLAHNGDGPHPTPPETLELARNQGFRLHPRDVLALWTDRHRAIVDLARAYGILPAEPGPLDDAERTIRITSPNGRIIETLRNHPTWPGSTHHVHIDQHGTYRASTLVLRTTNPYQARSMLIMLGAHPHDIADITGIAP